MSGDVFVTVDSDTEAMNTQEDKKTHYFYSMVAIGTVLILLLVGAVLIWQLVLKD